MSKESRMNAKKTKQKYRAKSTRNRILKIAIPVAIIAVVVFVIVREAYVYKENHPTADYSKGLTEAGLIEGFDSSMINLCDYKNIPVSEESLIATEDYVNQQIDNVLNQYATQPEDGGEAVKPEFTDEFVQTNLGNYASNTEEYIEYLKDTYYKNALASAVQSYITDNSSVNTYPNKYYKASIENEIFQYYYYFLSNSQYSSIKNMYDYYNLSKAELRANSEEAAKISVAFAMYMQAIYENEGLSYTEEELKNFITTTYTNGDYEQALNAYNGINYWAQQYIEQLTYNYIVENFINLI